MTPIHCPRKQIKDLLQEQEYPTKGPIICSWPTPLLVWTGQLVKTRKRLKTGGGLRGLRMIGLTGGEGSSRWYVVDDTLLQKKKRFDDITHVVRL